MRQAGGTSWRVSVNTSDAMLLALYLRDSAGLRSAGTPALSTVKPTVHCADPQQLVHAVGGWTALRIEWETWWYQLVSDYYNAARTLSPPDFPEFGAMPALQRLAHAHYGAAIAWVQDRKAAYVALCEIRSASGRQSLFNLLVEEREMELGRSARAFELDVVELPLSENRAWFIEPSKLIMSEELQDDPQAFRSYVQPVVELLA